MKKILLIALVVLTILIGGFMWWRMNSVPQTEVPKQQTGFPVSSSYSTDSPRIAIPAQNNATVNTLNFLTDTGTKEDSANKGYYFLGNQPEVQNPYVIVYIAETHYFNISLLQEPISESRAAAEAYLLQHLGLTKEQLCTLDYMVSVPDSVNNIYSDENLGFSFCQGAVQLP